MTYTAEDNHKPQMDDLLKTIVTYTLSEPRFSQEAYETAHHCLMDSMACALLSLTSTHCQHFLNTIHYHGHCIQGIPIPGTSLRLGLFEATFHISAMIRWLDFNDTWLAAEWGHPSDHIGAILSILYEMNRQQSATWTLKKVYEAMIKAYEIQGILSLSNSLNQHGFDHVFWVKIASTAVSGWLLGLSETQLLNALSQAFIDGAALRTYRHAPNTGSRKSWAAADASTRGLQLAWLSRFDEMGYPSALTAPRWGFYDVLWQGKPLTLTQPLGCYVMEHILFKISYPAEFHAQTAIECALHLHPQVRDHLDTIQTIRITTHAAAMRIINKQGPLYHPADRDHCLQYMVAVALLKGHLTAMDYEDEAAQDPRIDVLRQKIIVHESSEFSQHYLDPNQRAIPNRLEIFSHHGVCMGDVTILYPMGHRRRRIESYPLLLKKFEQSIQIYGQSDQHDRIHAMMLHPQRYDTMPIDDFMLSWPHPYNQLPDRTQNEV